MFFFICFIINVLYKFFLYVFICFHTCFLYVFRHVFYMFFTCFVYIFLHILYMFLYIFNIFFIYVFLNNPQPSISSKGLGLS